MLSAYNTLAPKKAANLSINADLLIKAKELEEKQRSAAPQ